MSNDTLTELVLRLESTERELAATQLRVRALQAQAMPRSRSRHDAIVVLLGLVLLFSVSRALDTHAQTAPPEVLTVKAPFQVVDASGKVVMRLDATAGGPRLTIGNPSAGGVTLAVTPSGVGGISVRTATGTEGVAIGQYRGGAMGVHLVGADNQTVKGSLELGSSGEGLLNIGDEKAGGALIGVGKDGGGYVIVRRPDATMGIGVGQLLGRPMSVAVFADNAKELASLRAGPKGGSVQVMNLAGTGVGGLLAGEGGGRIALTGPAGGKTAVGLSVEPSGGKVRVFPQDGGAAVAELTAEATGGGAVTVYTIAGEPVAMLQATSTGAGRFEISKAGKIYVEAGVLANGLGVVRAGPQIGGSLGGALTIPNAILGKSGH